MSAYNYRFLFANYEVKVVNSLGLSIEHKKEKGQVYFRPSLNKSIVLNKDCCVNFDLVWFNLMQANQENCANYYFSIQEGIGGEWYNIFEGTYKVLNFEVDKDLGEITIKIDPKDQYNCFLKDYKNKHDIINETLTQEDFTIGTDGYTFECLVESHMTLYDDAEDYPKIGWGIFDSDEEQWYEDLYYDEDPARELFIGYARLKSTQALSPNSYFEDGFFYTPYDTSVSVRTLSFVSSSHFEAVNLGSFPTGLEDEYTNTLYSNSLGGEFATSIPTIGWINAFDIMEYLLSKLECQLTLSSSILSDNYNYVTQEGNNPLKRLYFNVNSNITNAGDVEATIFDLSIDQFLKAVDILFQLKYKIEGNTFILEHISFFSDNANLIDLTTLQTKQYAEGKNKYKYRSSNLPHKENFELADQDRDKLIFTNYCPNESEKTHANKELYTNIALLVDNQSANPDGICVGIETDGVIGGSDTLLSNLIPKYYRHERPFEVGLLNDEIEVVAATIESNIEQTKVFPVLVNIHSFDPESKIKTFLGTGNMSEASIDLETKTATLTPILQHV